MPHFNVHLHEELLDGSIEPQVIAALTDAVVSVYGERARPLGVIELLGVPRNRWGVGGRPGSDNAPLVHLFMREPALSMPGIADPPAALISAITIAMATVFGDDVGQRTTVLITGVPTSRIGVAGEPVSPTTDTG